MEIRALPAEKKLACLPPIYSACIRVMLKQGWATDIIDVNEIGSGGIREVIFEIAQWAFSRLNMKEGSPRAKSTHH